MMFIPGCPCCCAECTAECDTTPDANFETVYQANDTDGTLQWSGDAMGPIDGPYPGFEGSGPFSQTITLAESFSVTMPGARFPCYFRVQFWRNVSGGTGSEALASQSVRINCLSGKLDVGVVVLLAGESVEWTTTPDDSDATYVFDGSPVTLVSGDEDQSGSPPFGWMGGVALCDGTTANVTASIRWENDAIQHSLYGAFVECFDELPPGNPGDCLDCDGTPTPAPETVYLTISNFDGGGAVDANGDEVNADGTYALDLSPTAIECARYVGDVQQWVAANVPPLSTAGRSAVVTLSAGLSVGYLANNTSGGVLAFGAVFALTQVQWLDLLCDNTLLSGSCSGQWQLAFGSGNEYSLSFDWELST